MRHRLLFLLTAALLSPLPAVAQEVPGQSPEQSSEAPEVQATDDPDAVALDAAKVPLEEIRRYVTIYNAVKQAYVDPVDDHKLMQSAVRGLLLDLDPHSAYLKKADAEKFDEQTRGTYDGVGIELQQLGDGSLRVVAPVDDGPAARAGVRSGDRIVAIDGKPLVAGAADGSMPLRGKAGTTVVLKIVRATQREPFDVSLVRETIHSSSVKSRLLEPGYGYVRIASFQAATATDFIKQLDALQKTTPLRGLVLDLRSNPGGLLIGAVQVADELLEKGGIVSTRGREALAVFSAAVTRPAPAADASSASPVSVPEPFTASTNAAIAGRTPSKALARVPAARWR